MISLMMIGALVGCGSSKDINMDVEKKADEILAAMDFKDDMIALNDEQLKYYYTSVDINDVNNYKVYLAASSAKAEEIAIFEAKDSDAAARLLDAVKERNEDLLFGFEDYLPEEFNITKNSYITNQGNYIIFIVGKNVEEGKKVIK